jgi:hypothetical protein
VSRAGKTDPPSPPVLVRVARRRPEWAQVRPSRHCGQAISGPARERRPGQPRRLLLEEIGASKRSINQNKPHTIVHPVGMFCNGSCASAARPATCLLSAAMDTGAPRAASTCNPLWAAFLAARPVLIHNKFAHLFLIPLIYPARCSDSGAVRHRDNPQELGTGRDV